MANGGLPDHAWPREAVITALALVLYLFGAAIQPEPDDGLTPPPFSVYPLAVVSCAALPLRHRAPRTVVALTAGCGVLAPALGFDFNLLLLVPVMIAAYALASRPASREVSVPTVATTAALAASSLVDGLGSWQESGTASAVAVPLLATVIGGSVRNRRSYLAAVEERARRAEECRESEARRRVVEERMRIARDLHDVVAHHITLVHAQASVATLFFDSRPEEARESLDRLTENTSSALDELRATVGLLRQSGDPGAPLDPPPGLAELPALAESFGPAGLAVSVSVCANGPARPLSPGADLTAYRIVQEALTNVAKHAGTGAARVDLAYGHDRLTITVTDDGRQAAGAADRPPGYGLIGMRERAAAVGGRLSAGPRREGGYLVTAELPLPPPREATGPGTRGDEGRAAP
ncbi:sensor histidine kinase [Streptomyces litchfieldiae]|uniref:histidine kinase n=1 Tax=Streptomyces litchfieldiae TaxID=3075543 RepID=A0ABU2MIQ0_9ACTN|nr:sensor histidine kinase [Streptomyces sp. DSM 44938]MDT0341477.1 sensor histidine kinase [Streptomyces sp. DSM 44938]